MYNFDLIRPASLKDAIAALQEEDAQALGGGQTLIPTLKARLAMPSTLVCLSGLSEIVGICEGDDGRVCIGGATTHAQIARDETQVPALAALAGQIGDAAVRTRGTIGGSVANNDPSACYPAAVLACGAEVVTPTRGIAADDFFQGLFETALTDGEIITEVRFPVPTRAAYAKFEQPASRFALVGVFVADFDGEVRVAVTGASGNGVFRWSEAEAALSRAFSPNALDGLQVDPDGMLSDPHGAADYRAHLIGVMTRRAVEMARA
ncbi:FAD binding domain-containing protein [Celeribacter marinus]|uniref:Carbon monoxide dehydrogenase medium chain n=1 Tax=Celeribacter marinus TaxID=1397108 RepID=A0A0N9ZKA8_9RHOB|nr:xanthine dehydrogenase family protein subunit M [Celeribacter marinus]ALI56104.1 carbon monoxide dehydrogenase medium chain [Celeribacter marinus]SFK93680.1 carbon-monoxide dehydrogenase medium subunit [Celeribacter marinus]